MRKGIAILILSIMYSTLLLKIASGQNVPVAKTFCYPISAGAWAFEGAWGKFGRNNGSNSWHVAWDTAAKEDGPDSCPIGTPIYAPCDMKVVFSCIKVGGYGPKGDDGYIVMASFRDPENYQGMGTIYTMLFGHVQYNKDITYDKVKQEGCAPIGENLKKGDYICRLAAYHKRPHLHWSIRKGYFKPGTVPTEKWVRGYDPNNWNADHTKHDDFIDPLKYITEKMVGLTDSGAKWDNDMSDKFKEIFTKCGGVKEMGYVINDTEGFVGMQFRTHKLGQPQSALEEDSCIVQHFSKLGKEYPYRNFIVYTGTFHNVRHVYRIKPPISDFWYKWNGWRYYGVPTSDLSIYYEVSSGVKLYIQKFWLRSNDNRVNIGYEEGSDNVRVYKDNEITRNPDECLYKLVNHNSKYKMIIPNTKHKYWKTK